MAPALARLRMKVWSIAAFPVGPDRGFGPVRGPSFMPATMTLPGGASATLSRFERCLFFSSPPMKVSPTLTGPSKRSSHGGEFPSFRASRIR